MTGKRRWVWWFSATLALTLLAGGAGLALWRAQESTTRLSIKITGLPGNARPTVTVAGANGFEQSVTASITLQVPPGSVRVTPTPVKADHATYYTPDDVLTTEVGKGESSRMAVDYRIAVSDRTTILNPASTGLLERPSKSRLVFARTSQDARSLKSGDFIVAAETPVTPDGLVRKVQGVSEQGDRLVVRTEEASLRNAMPKAVLRFGRPATDRASGLALAAHGMPAQSPADPEPEGQAEGTIKLDTLAGKGKLEGLKCGASLPLMKAENNDIIVNMDGTDIGWTQSTVKLHVKETTKLTLGSPVSTHCSYDMELGRMRAPYVTAQLLRVGPFKVVPELSWRLGGELKGGAGAKIEYDNPIDYRVTARIGQEDNSVTATGWPPKPSVDLIGAAEFKAKATLGWRITLEASPVIDLLVAEVYVGTGFALETEIDVLKENAKVKFFAEGTAGVGIIPGLLGEARTAEIAFPLGKPTTVWESSPGEVAAAKPKADRSNTSPCPTPASLKAAVTRTLQAPSDVYLGVNRCWPGWSAVVWSDTPASDSVIVSVFTRTAGQLRLAKHLVPAMDDPDDPDWLRDCRELLGMKPPAGLIDFVGCPTSTQAPTTNIDGAAALRLIHQQNFTTTVTADELAGMPGPLRAVTASCVDSANGNCVSVFFFYGDRYVGQAAGSSQLQIATQNGSEVTLSRPIFKDTDPTCCPSGGNETHRVRWNGTAVVSSPSLPHYEQANEPL
ncbi:MULTISPECIES: LppP/LprE family lipoprotein [unclassified Streptomyces]|uniref:LppP/LprE family lipoprotein n=1 Tax=unclassified Streptomyces TaxID=2593676 RepID=UPI0035E38F81